MKPRIPRPAPAIPLLLLALLAPAGCEKRREVAEAFPVALTREAVCAVDGMVLLDHPGPKGQIHFADGSVEYFCDVREFYQTWYDPDRRHRIRAGFLQPFDDREWGSYAGGWERPGELVYVLDSRRMGAMGPTIVPFRRRAAARAFIGRAGGTLVAAEALDAARVRDYARRVRERMRHGEMPAPGGKPGSGHDGTTDAPPDAAGPNR